MIPFLLENGDTNALIKAWEKDSQKHDDIKVGGH